MTTYNIFMHFYNDDIGKAVTNETECKWYSCLTTPSQYGNLNSSNKYLQPSDMNKSKVARDKECLEVLYISPSASTSANENTKAYEDYIVKNATVSNPKYDMIFVWDGMGTYTSTHDGANDEVVQLYFDKMKKADFKPWFFHSTYHSLRAAITKAEQLVDLFGKDHIMIGKEVALDQYIDIV